MEVLKCFPIDGVCALCGTNDDREYVMIPVYYNVGQDIKYGSLHAHVECVCKLSKDFDQNKSEDSQDWPRTPALKYKVPVGEIACPHCGSVQSGVLNPICGSCDRPYWTEDQMKEENNPYLYRNELYALKEVLIKNGTILEEMLNKQNKSIFNIMIDYFKRK